MTVSPEVEQAASLLLEEVRIRIASLAQAKKRYSAQLAPDFYLLDFLRRDENGLSRYFALLLDPQGVHGQGALFLKAFIGCLGEAASWALAAEHCQVVTEQQANGQRRIDIFLRLDNGLIAIENKPWAADQKNQLKDYAAYIHEQATGQRSLLVYLGNEEPNESSISLVERQALECEQRFVQINYSQAIAWLQSAVVHCQAAKVRLFVEELIEFIRCHINGESEVVETQELKELILTSAGNIDAALRVAASISAVKNQLLQDFERELKTALAEQDMPLSEVSLTADAKRYAGFSIELHSAHKFCLRFEFDGSGLRWLAWGICRNAETVLHESEKWQQINQAMSEYFGKGDSSEWWPWYPANGEMVAVFPANYMDWSSSPEPWLLMRDKTEEGMVKRIVRLAVKARAALESVHEVMV